MKPGQRIAGLIGSGEILVSNHARVRMFELNISTDDLINIIPSGEIIEDYPDDVPCPSVLLVGFINSVAYHTVVAVCTDHIRVITVYIPVEDKRIEYRRRRNEP